MRIIVMMVVRTLGAVAVAAAALTGCASSAGSGSADPTVVVSFYPLQYVAERVSGEHTRVANLTTPGVEPHDLELTVHQSVDIAESDLVLYLAGFQPAVDEAIEQSGPERVVDTTKTVPLEADDPHFWLDPTMLSRLAVVYEQELAEVDPDNAADYERNLAALRSDLADMDERYRTGLADCEVETVVVSHDAFGYLRRYGLDFVAINGLSPGAEPSPAHIAELSELIVSEGITTVFSETLASPQLSRTLADDLGITTGVLDPIEGLGESTQDENYLSLMRRNLTALQEANRCP